MIIIIIIYYLKQQNVETNQRRRRILSGSTHLVKTKTLSIKVHCFIAYSRLILLI